MNKIDWGKRDKSREFTAFSSEGDKFQEVSTSSRETSKKVLKEAFNRINKCDPEYIIDWENKTIQKL